MVTSTYSTVTMASEPKMPRGRSLFGLLGFLGGGGDHVEPDEREEHHRGRGQDAEHPEVARRAAGDQLQQRLVQGPATTRDGWAGGMNGQVARR